MPRIAACLIVLVLAGCGGEKPGPPNKLDIAQVTASANRIAASCSPDVEPGTLVDEAAIARDVDKVIAVYRRSDPNARFQLEGGGEPTTMRDLMRTLAYAFREGPCSVASLDRIEGALRET